MPRYSFRVLVVASLTAALVSSMGPGLPQKVAGHTTDKYGWGDCNWGWKDDDVTPNILVRTDPNYPFPADVWVDGVLNSFERGTTEALAEWNTVLYRTSLGLRTRFERVSSTSFAHIVLQFNSTLLPSGAYGGTFLTNHDPGDCVVHSPVNDILTGGVIRIRPLTNPNFGWFTQDDSRRSFWESYCPSHVDQTYTCRKHLDYDSTITHELGHVFRLYHPSDVDIHIGCIHPCNPNEVFEVWADCTPPGVVGLDQATMCNYGHEYRTEQRTYHAWDLESLKRLYNCHLNGISCT